MIEASVIDRPHACGAAQYSSAPRVPNAHLFDAGGRAMLLSVQRGRLYEIDDTPEA